MKVRFAVAPSAEVIEMSEIVGFAEALEAGGFDGVWLSDVPVKPVLDPLIGLALIAGRTSRLRLGANVVPLGRNPFLLAKALAQLDQISGGRLLLSFVAGLDHPGESDVLRLNGARRGAVLEEVLGLVRSWWAGEPVEDHSTDGLLASFASAARPAQEPLEVWLGGRGPKALDRVGRLADGWLGAMLTPEEARDACARISDSAVRAGRRFDPEHFGVSLAYARSTPEAGVLDDYRRRRDGIDPSALLPVGADALRALILRYVDAGLSKFVVRPATRVVNWKDEVRWLGAALLDLQT